MRALKLPVSDLANLVSWQFAWWSAIDAIEVHRIGFSFRDGNIERDSFRDLVESLFPLTYNICTTSR